MYLPEDQLLPRGSWHAGISEASKRRAWCFISRAAKSVSRFEDKETLLASEHPKVYRKISLRAASSGLPMDVQTPVDQSSKEEGAEQHLQKHGSCTLHQRAELQATSISILCAVPRLACCSWSLPQYNNSFVKWTKLLYSFDISTTVSHVRVAGDHYTEAACISVLHTSVARACVNTSYMLFRDKASTMRCE